LHALLLRTLLFLHDLLLRLLPGSAFPAQAAADLDHCFSGTSARVAKITSTLLLCY
jgi:hypothetical protein